MRLLVVEDQKKMAQFLKKGLEQAGYAVDLSESTAGAESLASETEYDLVIMDLMLSEGSGLEATRHIRAEGYRGPLLMLTALSATQDKVRGLDAGADDYLTKPFSFDELLARIRALIRRKGDGAGLATKLRYSDLELDLTSRRTTRAGQEIKLTAKEFSLLEYLMRNVERPVSRVQIAEHVWDVNFDIESNVIDVYINMLRKKVENQATAKRLIHTLVGVGYVLRENP